MPSRRLRLLRHKRIVAALRFADLTADDLLFVLGSGEGRVVLWAAEALDLGIAKL